MHPETGPAASDISPAGRYGIGSFNADVRLVEVQSVAELHSPVSQAFDMELVKLGVAVVHVFERQIACRDSRSFINLSGSPGGLLLDLI